MKKSYLLLSLIAIFLWGCDGLTEPDIFAGPDFVAYDGITSSFAIAENSTSAISITVNMSVAQSSDTQVTLGVDNVNVTEGVDYMIGGVSGSTLTIPAGEFSRSFTITPIDNTFFNSDAAGNGLDRRIVFTLSSNSANLVNGHADDQTREIVFIDDDCPITISDFVGTWAVQEMFTGPPNAPLGLSDFLGEVYQLEFSLDPADDTNTRVIINNSTGANQYLPDGLGMTFNTCDMSISIDGGDPPLAAQGFPFAITSSVYSDSDFTIQADGELANFGMYQFVFTKL